MYKKTKWTVFTRKINNQYNSQIPAFTNLSNSEIDQYIDKIDSVLVSAIDKYVPRYKPHDNVLNYLSTKLKKLHKHESFLITALNTEYKNNNLNKQNNIRHLKLLINSINILLKSGYHTTYDKFWDKQYSSIDHSKSHLFFPKINKIFRPKNFPKIESILLEKQFTNLLDRTKCPITELPVVDGKYLIQTPQNILNVVAFLETVNMPRYTNNNTTLFTQVNKKQMNYSLTSTMK